jgi:chaperonin GroES
VLKARHKTLGVIPVAARLERRKIHMSFRPLGDRVLIKRVEEEAKTRGGIIIPDTAKEKPQEGEVIAVGPGARDDSGKVQPLDVKPGDRILFGKWSGSEVKLDGQDLLIMKEGDILGVLDAVKAAVAA